MVVTDFRGKTEREIAQDLARHAPRNVEAIAYLELTRRESQKKDEEN